MKKRGLAGLIIAGLLVVGPARADEEVQWVRVTVLLESTLGSAYRAEETLVPGGVYSRGEVERRGRDAIDKEILERVRFLGESMRGVEDRMRLATLLARQYYLPLEVGKQAVLPVIDINPRLGVVFSPLRFVGSRAVCTVQILEPEGPEKSPEFTGDPISLRLQDADLRDVLATFSMVANIHILVDPSVEAKVSVDLRDVPWDQALDLILRTNGLGWVKEDGGLRVAPLDEMSRRKRVRTEATITLPRGTWGSRTIASEGDAENPTMVLVVESVDGPPELAAERDGLVRAKSVQLVPPKIEEVENSLGELAVFRGTVDEEGRLRGIQVLASPSSGYSERLAKALERWRLHLVLDEEGRRQEAVVGFGLRLEPIRALASISAVEHVGVELKVGSPPPEYAPNHPDSVVATAFVSNLDTGEIISAPRILIPKAEEGTIRAFFVAPSGEPSKFEMKVFVSEDGDNVRCSWTITTDGKVVSSHKSEFEL
jgi:hypothetical protein